MTSIRANKCHTGAAIVKCRTKRNITKLQRTKRIYLRTEYRLTPKTMNREASIGVLDAQLTTITITQIIAAPRTQTWLPLTPPTNHGTTLTQKHPANIGCEKAPMQRKRPSRISVTSGTPPNTEKTLRPVIRSIQNERATGKASATKDWIRNSISLQLRSTHRK